MSVDAVTPKLMVQSESYAGSYHSDSDPIVITTIVIAMLAISIFNFQTWMLLALESGDFSVSVALSSSLFKATVQIITQFATQLNSVVLCST